MQGPAEFSAVQPPVLNIGDGAVNLYLQVVGNRDLSQVEQAVQIGTEKKAIVHVVRSACGNWDDVSCFKSEGLGTTRDCATTAIRMEKIGPELCLSDTDRD